MGDGDYKPRKWSFGSTAFCGDANMLVGEKRSARYYPLADPWGCYKIELWGEASHVVFGPMRCERRNTENDARIACEEWVD